MQPILGMKCSAHKTRSNVVARFFLSSFPISPALRYLLAPHHNTDNGRVVSNPEVNSRRIVPRPGIKGRADPPGWPLNVVLDNFIRKCLQVALFNFGVI